jgi:hypothetical protein
MAEETPTGVPQAEWEALQRKVFCRLSFSLSRFFAWFLCIRARFVSELVCRGEKVGEGKKMLGGTLRPIALEFASCFPPRAHAGGQIFTRWVNQKLTSHRLPQIKDVVTDLGTGDTLKGLIETLSEKEMAKSPKKPATAFAASTHQQMEAVGTVLKFMWDCGVDMKLKPSAENILKGDRRDVRLLLCTC